MVEKKIEFLPHFDNWPKITVVNLPRDPDVVGDDEEHEHDGQDGGDDDEDDGGDGQSVLRDRNVAVLADVDPVVGVQDQTLGLELPGQRGEDQIVLAANAAKRGNVAWTAPSGPTLSQFTSLKIRRSQLSNNILEDRQPTNFEALKL